MGAKTVLCCSAIQQRPAGRDGADGTDQVGAPDLFQDASRRAGENRVEERVIVGERRKHRAGEFRPLRTQLAAGGYPGQGLRRGAGLTDDLDVRLVLGVGDNGNGTPNGGRRSGLANLAARAAQLGGGLSVRSGPGAERF